jgi:glycosyltransferase involved in cell wall biosynthesis
MISIAGIGKLRKPVVWTLHDMWAFCGAEHYTEDQRWSEGYSKENCPNHGGGIDINRWTWKRKSRHWKRQFNIVTPSKWLAECVQASALMHEWPVTVVPNPIDTDAWRPVDRQIARKMLNLPLEEPLLLFGAMGGSSDTRKGFDLLSEALDHLRLEKRRLELVVFGQRAPRTPENLGFPVHFMGHLHDHISLNVLYSAADAMIFPSRQDNLPNTVMEAMTSGTPCVAFHIGGLPDMIEHLTSGYLAKPFDSEDLARGIQWVLENEDRRLKLGGAARKYAEEKWSYPVVAEQYLAVYEKALGQSM